jgi:hypothetical protein
MCLNESVEKVAAKFHDIYQQEAKRQGDVRHADVYENLPEKTKEFDRALARFVIGNIAMACDSEGYIHRSEIVHALALADIPITGTSVCKD